MTTVNFVGRRRGFRGMGGGFRRPMMGRRGAFMGLGCLLPILCLGAVVVAYLFLSGGRKLGPFGSPASGGFSQQQTFTTSRGAVPLPEFQARPASERFGEARYGSSDATRPHKPVTKLNSSSLTAWPMFGYSRSVTSPPKRLSASAV